MGWTYAASSWALVPAPATAAVLLLLLLRPTDSVRWEVTDANCTTHPVAIKATNETLTVVARFRYLPNCRHAYLVWQAKSWVEEDWYRQGETRVDTPYTFTHLVPGVGYDVRAVPYSEEKPCSDCEVEVTRAYTCSGEVPPPEDFSFTKREDNYIKFAWKVPEHACASVDFLIQVDEPFDEDKFMDGCPPPFLASPQPQYRCTDDWHRTCEGRLDGIAPHGRYYVGVIGVDWLGNCSLRDWNVSDPEGPGPWRVGEWALLGLTLLAIIVATPLLFKKVRRRLRGIGNDRPRITFTPERSSVDTVSNAAVGNGGESCNASEAPTRSGNFLTVPLHM